MITPLVATKYQAPPLNVGLIQRPRLLHCLDTVLQTGRRLTLISAPAGYGKTTLLLQWLERQRQSASAALSNDAWVAGAAADAQSAISVDCAWLTVDGADNDPVRFFSYLVTALRSASVLHCAEADVLLQAADPFSVSALLSALTNAIAAAERPIVVILDDYHEISSQSVHEIVAFLLQYAPANLHVVIATRSDPPLPLARLRGRNQISELRQHDLRFADWEASQLLEASLASSLQPALVKMLNARAEGWAVGLQMAAISLQGNAEPEQFVYAFSGSHRHILDYLSEEVLNRQPPTIQHFLERTSILERLCAPLCHALLTDQFDLGDIEAILGRLEQDNLFIVPLDHERRWYRYHHLFRDLLRQRLMAREPGLIQQLHDRASHYCVDAGLMHEAVEYALGASDQSRAAELIAFMAESTMKSSEVATLRRWIETLSAEAVGACPMLQIYYAGTLLLMGEPATTVESHLCTTLVAPSGAGTTATAFQALAAALRGDRPVEDRLAQRALEVLPEHSPFFRSCVSLATGINNLFAGEDSAAADALRTTIALSDPDGAVMNAVLARAYLAQLAILQGNLDDAHRLYEQALIESQSEPIGGIALLGLGSLHYDWNNLGQADKLITGGLELVMGWSQLPVAQGALLLARIKWLVGDHAAAQQLERRSEAMLAQCHEMASIHKVLHLFFMQYALWKGDLPAAEQHASRAGLHIDPISTVNGAHRHNANLDFADAATHIQPHSMEATFALFATARLCLASGRYAQASAIALQAAEHAVACGRMRLVANAQIIHALARFADGDHHEAANVLCSALAIAAPQRSIRLFVDEGEAMAELLMHCRRNARYGAYAGRLLDAFAADATGTGAVTGAGDEDDPFRPGSQMCEPALVIEPLSEREQQVLRLMAAGESNREISERLNIAPSTVKTHIHSIFRKLQATRRTQAIARAHTCNIL